MSPFPLQKGTDIPNTKILLLLRLQLRLYLLIIEQLLLGIRL